MAFLVRSLPMLTVTGFAFLWFSSMQAWSWPWTKDYGCKKGDFIVITLSGDSSKLAGKVLKVNDQGIKIRQIQLDIFSFLALLLQALADKQPPQEKFKIILGGEYFVPWTNIATHEPVELSSDYFQVIEP